MGFQGSFAICSLDLVSGGGTLEIQDIVRIDGRWLPIHNVFEIRHGCYQQVVGGDDDDDRR